MSVQFWGEILQAIIELFPSERKYIWLSASLYFKSEIIKSLQHYKTDSISMIQESHHKYCYPIHR